MTAPVYSRAKGGRVLHFRELGAEASVARYAALCGFVPAGEWTGPEKGSPTAIPGWPLCSECKVWNDRLQEVEAHGGR